MGFWEIVAAVVIGTAIFHAINTFGGAILERLFGK